MKGPTLFGMLHFCVQMFLSGKCFALDWSLSTSPLPPPPQSVFQMGLEGSIWNTKSVHLSV